MCLSMTGKDQSESQHTEGAMKKNSVYISQRKDFNPYHCSESLSSLRKQQKLVSMHGNMCHKHRENKEVRKSKPRRKLFLNV